MKNKILKLSVQNKIFTIMFLALSFLIPHKTHAANLSISPNTLNVFVGDTITMKINVNTLGKSINNVEGIIQFPADMLEVLSLQKTSSIFSLWVEEPSFSSNAGQITFNGGLPTPGFVGQNGNVLSVTFKVKKQGTASIVFANGNVRENDGLGTDITGNLTGATIYIKKTTIPPISTPTNPTSISVPKITPKTAPKTTPKIVTEIIPETTLEVSEPLPIPQAPEIISEIKDGAVFVVGSSGYPQAQVLLTFVSQDGTKILVLGVADMNGNFNILVPNSLKPSSYAVTATMIQEDKTNSEASNAIIIKIDNIIFNVSFEMWLFIITIIILILNLITQTYFYFIKNKNINKLTKNKLDEAENVINQSFNFLRSDLADRAGRIVNSVERVNIEELKKDIDSTEKIITKNIKDIG
ncbi:MAG: cohesin domain-containing protein [Candidatus Paceibacterota bacterium]|jgi:hypothetical protein